MKKGLLLLLLVHSINTVSGQNLVLNPGIDSYITCPGFGQFSNAFIVSWNKPTIASSDYYNFNCQFIQPTAQAPHSGEGYAGIYCYNFGTEYREYITGTFSTPLVAGTLYNVEFWVSLNDGYIQAIEEIGAYISTAMPGPFSNALHINVIPQIENINGALTDTAGWQKIDGQFLAAGGEQYITIGNFYDDAGTTITQPGTVGSFGAYYFVDDVSVKADSTTSVEDHQQFQNPKIALLNGNILQVQLPETHEWKNQCQLYCFSTSGKLLKTTLINTSTTMLDLKELSAGIYLVRLENKSGEFQSTKIAIQ